MLLVTLDVDTAISYISMHCIQTGVRNVVKGNSGEQQQASFVDYFTLSEIISGLLDGLSFHIVEQLVCDL